MYGDTVQCQTINSLIVFFDDVKHIFKSAYPLTSPSRAMTFKKKNK